MLLAEVGLEIRAVESLCVSVRLSAGQDAETIRREATKVAAETIVARVSDAWLQETLMEQHRDAIERALAEEADFDGA